MADNTVIDDILMIEIGLGKCRGYVTHRAILDRRDMPGRIGLGILTGCYDSIVARCTVIDDAGMLNISFAKVPGT